MHRKFPTSLSWQLVALIIVALVLISIGVPWLSTQRRAASLVSPALISSPLRFRMPADFDDPANTTAILLLANLSQREKQRVRITGVADGKRDDSAEVEIGPNETVLLNFLAAELKGTVVRVRALRGNTGRDLNPAPLAASLWLNTTRADGTIAQLSAVTPRRSLTTALRRRTARRFERGRVIPFTSVPLSPTYQYSSITIKLERACQRSCKSASYHLLFVYGGDVVKSYPFQLAVNDQPKELELLSLLPEGVDPANNGYFAIIPESNRQARLNVSAIVRPNPLDIEDRVNLKGQGLSAVGETELPLPIGGVLGVDGTNIDVARAIVPTSEGSGADSPEDSGTPNEPDDIREPGLPPEEPKDNPGVTNPEPSGSRCERDADCGENEKCCLAEDVGEDYFRNRYLRRAESTEKLSHCAPKQFKCCQRVEDGIDESGPFLADKVIAYGVSGERECCPYDGCAQGKKCCVYTNEDWRKFWDYPDLYPGSVEFVQCVDDEGGCCRGFEGGVCPKGSSCCKGEEQEVACIPEGRPCCYGADDRSCAPGQYCCDGNSYGQFCVEESGQCCNVPNTDNGHCPFDWHCCRGRGVDTDYCAPKDHECCPDSEQLWCEPEEQCCADVVINDPSDPTVDILVKGPGCIPRQWPPDDQVRDGWPKFPPGTGDFERGEITCCVGRKQTACPPGHKCRWRAFAGFVLDYYCVPKDCGIEVACNNAEADLVWDGYSWSTALCGPDCRACPAGCIPDLFGEEMYYGGDGVSIGTLKAIQCTCECPPPQPGYNPLGDYSMAFGPPGSCVAGATDCSESAAALARWCRENPSYVYTACVGDNSGGLSGGSGQCKFSSTPAICQPACYGSRVGEVG